MAEEPTMLWCCQTSLYGKSLFNIEVTFLQITTQVKVKFNPRTGHNVEEDIALLFL